MILILSQEKDISTSNVIDWLYYYDKEFKRINEEDSLDFDLNIDNTTCQVLIKLKEETINLENFETYWYRRGNFILNEKYLKGDNDTIRSINIHYKEAYEDIKQYLHDYVKKKSFKINSYSDNYLNKLTELTVAKEIGIHIPDTIITTKKSSVIPFMDKHNRIITKSIKGTLLLKIETTTFYWHTLLVTHSDVENFPENFNPAKFQQYIEKPALCRIVHNHRHASSRQQSNIMHELAHVIAKHEKPDIHKDINLPFFMRDFDKQQEEEANYLGSTLQITRDGLLWALRKRMQEAEIAEHFNASPAMVQLRINTTGVKRQLSYLT